MTTTTDWQTRVRTEDPQSSRDAAASQRAENITKVQAAVLDLMSELGEATDEELATAYGAREGLPPHTPDGLRHRRGELVTRGLLAETGELRPNRSGRRARVWRYVGPDGGSTGITVA